MPCYDARDDEIISNLRKQNNHLASMLCAMCRAVELANARISWPSEVIGWWAEHKRFDRQREREAAEKLQRLATRRKVLAKLTATERKLLGVS